MSEEGTFSYFWNTALEQDVDILSDYRVKPSFTCFPSDFELFEAIWSALQVPLTSLEPRNTQNNSN